MMTITLYHGEPNGPSLTVLAALFEKQVEAELVAIDLAAGERHTKAPRNTQVDLSVEGEGPVLVADGEPLADSVFVAVYLDDIGLGPAIVPADPYDRWEMMTWCRWVIERVAPAASYLGARKHLAGSLAALDDATFAALTAPIVSEDLKWRWEDIRAGRFDEAKVADSQAKIRAAVARTEDRLDDRAWLMGDFSVADLESYAWLAGMSEVLPRVFDDAPRTQAWLNRVKARPSVARALARATVADPRRVWAPGPEINRWG